MFSEEIQSLAERLVARCAERGWSVTTAESCTGGLVAAAITAVPGASAMFDRGLITYSNAAKHALLGVPEALFDMHGAVSEAVARAMALGARDRATARFGVAITGVAGPGGGTAAKPVGLVHLACASPKGLVHREHYFGDLGRARVQMAAVRAALQLLCDAAEVDQP